MNDIEFKSTFDKIEYDIAMEMYMKHNSHIASIYDTLGEVYDYDDLKDAQALEEHDTLQEYKKALKEKCDAIDKATGMLEFLVFNGERPLTINELNKLYYILKGSEDND